jgi:hypothetical protein
MYIHQVIIKSLNDGAPKLVMIHGYGAGAAGFMRMVPFL